MSNLIWDSDDFDEVVDESGLVHDSDSDHPGSDILSRGYWLNDSYSLNANGLVGWWPLHDDSAQDLSGNGNDGTVNGPTTGVAGRGGLQAMSFDGSNNIKIGDLDLFQTFPLSYSAWFKPSSVGSNNRAIIEKGAITANPGGGLFVDTDGTVAWNAMNPDTGNGCFQQQCSGGNIVENSWYHAVGVWSGENSDPLRLYINGTQVASVKQQNSGTDPRTNLEIGKYGGPSGGHFKGTIADVRIYNRALTQSEIQTLYEWGSGDYAVPASQDDGGVSYYDFNSSNADDKWGSNDGTVNGATYVSDGGPRGDGAYSFNGSDNYIDTKIQQLDFPLTIAGWMYSNDTSISASLFGNNSSSGSEDLYIVHGTNGDIVFRVDGAAGSLGNVKMIEDTWYHFAGTVDSNSQTLYVNGIRNDSGNGTSADSQDNGSNYQIGNLPSSSPLDGYIDDVRIYNRALEPWEIHELYQYGTLGRDMRPMVVNQ